ncbi:MAG: phosphoribosylformylglycinamidine cyclo-ligase [Pelagibacterales bacterium]|nr:phosphoribosylformylglycinamidine cyclo-ligase [Pelagibacterales bacterium]
MSLNYKQAGVDIDAGNELVNRIKPFAKATKRIGADSDLGGFGALFDLKKCNYKDPILVSSTDGVGTKLKVAIELGKHDTIGIDLVAMSVNDLLAQGAEPLFFLDYFACSKLEVNVAADVIKGISEGCKQANCALIGGETAEMPGMYTSGDYDLAGFAVGAVERDAILPKETKSGDILIGLKSSGVHSNGYSLARYILKQNNIKFEDKIAEFGNKTIGEVLLTPTKVYVRSCLEAIKTGKVKALAHITGGGLVENLPRVLKEGLTPKIDYNSWERPQIFPYLQKLGNVTDSEMHRTFNCGIGMVLVVDKSNVEEIKQILTNAGEEVFVIGNLE